MRRLDLTKPIAALLLLGIWTQHPAVFAAEKSRMKIRPNATEDTLPRVIRVERTSPVFKNASSRSKIVADVEIGTVLIARVLSPQSSWILVEDEDGNRGWMPVNRTNYKMIAPPKEIVSDEEITSAEKENSDHAASRISPLNSLFAEASVSNHGYGGAVSYLLRQSMDSPYSRERRLGLDVGAYRDWDAGTSKIRSYTVPMHVRMMARDPGSNFFSGPDLGTSFRVKDSSWGSGLGYSIGYISDLQTGLVTRFRAGVEWGGKTRHVFSWSLGWVF